MSGPTRQGALAALREGRVTILTAYLAEPGGGPPIAVDAAVHSSRNLNTRYIVDLIQGRWACTCPLWQSTNRCAHLYAVQLVTGHYEED